MKVKVNAYQVTEAQHKKVVELATKPEFANVPILAARAELEAEDWSVEDAAINLRAILKENGGKWPEKKKKA